MVLMKLPYLLILCGALLGSAGQAQTQPAADALPTVSAVQQTNAPPVSSNVRDPKTSGTTADESGDDPQPIETYRKTVDLVPVIFTVTDKHGKFVKDLKQDQFKILDNNRPPKQVLSFEAQTDLPLRVGMLIDASNSIRDRFLFEQQASEQFLQAIIRSQTDKAFVLAFDEVSEVTQDFTNDVSKLTAGIRVFVRVAAPRCGMRFTMPAATR
jgi:Ca-activated chloride channel homolog